MHCNKQQTALGSNNKERVKLKRDWLEPLSTATLSLHNAHHRATGPSGLRQPLVRTPPTNQTKPKVMAMVGGIISNHQPTLHLPSSPLTKQNKGHSKPTTSENKNYFFPQAFYIPEKSLFDPARIGHQVSSATLYSLLKIQTGSTDSKSSDVSESNQLCYLLYTEQT